MNIVVIGANGQLGTDLMNCFDNAVGLTHADIEVSDIDNVGEVLTALNPSIVINTAAYHNTDECEDNPAKTFDVNTHGAYNVAKVTKALGSKNVYVSTDYVFDGLNDTPYSETDCVNPVNIYGASKAAGENVTQIMNPKSFIIRCSGLYGLTTSGKGHNFPDLMIKLSKERDEIKVVQDEVLTPTYTEDLSQKILEVSNTEKYGVYHMTNSGECSWFDFAKKTLDIIDSDTKVIPAGPDDFPKRARRPRYSVLDNKNLRENGFSDMRDWREALREFLKIKYGV